MPAITILVERSPGSLTVQLPSAEISLSADVREYEGMISARASGPATAAMPDRGEVDACLAKLKQANPEAFAEGDNAYLAQTCKAGARMTEPVPVTVNVELAVFEAPDAMLTMTRRYADEDGALAETHGVDTIGACTMSAP
jgi:hypothetical protein